MLLVNLHKLFKLPDIQILKYQFEYSILKYIRRVFFMNLKGKFSKFLGAITATVMGITMLPQVSLTSFAASPGDKLSVGSGTSQHKGVSDGYSYEIWIDSTGGSGSMTLGSGGAFKAEWSANVSRGNFLARRGKDYGSTTKATQVGNIVLDYAADYRQTGSASGNSRLCVYGWFQNKGAAGNVPLVEYYIIEDWVDWVPDAQGKMVTIDGAQYKIFQMDHTGPTINGGSETFKQYYSVRQQKRKSGTITVSDHFKAWESQGWGIGNLYEVALNAEGWQSSGVADITKLVISDKAPTQTTQTTQTTQPAQEVSGSAPSGSGSGISDGFENAGTDWTARGEDLTLKLTSSFKHGGSKSLYVGGRTQSWNGLSASTSELKAGGSYSFSSYVGFNDTNYSSSDFTFGVQYDLNGTTSYENISDATASSGQWAELGGDFSIPSGATNISLYVHTAYVETPTAKDLIGFFLDDVKLSGGSVSTQPATTTQPGTVSSDSLKDAFSGFFKVGTSVSPNELSSGASFIKKHFNSITPENELKPDALIDQSACQQKGNNVNTQISLSRASQTLKFCEDNGIALRGHTFVWYSQTPDWFFRENFNSSGAYVSTTIMNQRLESFIKNTFDALKTQYPKLNIYSYDVCNELFVNDGGGLRPANNSNWTRIYGDDTFIFKAFEYARKYAPAGCKLFINDYNEYIPAKTSDIYNIAMKLKEKGLIDGIGMQSHLDVSYPSAQVFKTGLEKFLSTGLEVQVTELDITCGDATAQAKLFADVFKMCMAYPNQIKAVTVWGTHDSISWRRENNPLMFGANYTPKQAYTEVMKVAASATPVITTTTTAAATTTTTTTTKATTTTTVTTLPSIVYGDFNGDGRVTNVDLVTISQHLVGDIQLSGANLQSADVTNDGKVDVADLALMKQFIMGDYVVLGKR